MNPEPKSAFQQFAETAAKDAKAISRQQLRRLVKPVIRWPKATRILLLALTAAIYISLMATSHIQGTKITFRLALALLALTPLLSAALTYAALYAAWNLLDTFNEAKLALRKRHSGPGPNSTGQDQEPQP